MSLRYHFGKKGLGDDVKSLAKTIDSSQNLVGEGGFTSPRSRNTRLISPSRTLER